MFNLYFFLTQNHGHCRKHKAKNPFLFRNEFSLLLLEVGGDKRDRTADLLNAIQALSQLSYTPRCEEAKYEVLTCGIAVQRDL